MEKKSLESFKEYARRWRDMAAEVQPLLTDKEMTSMFMNTLRTPLYERMIGNASTKFSDIIVIGERIEYGIKHGRLAEATIEYGGIKKGTISKKKEGEVHAIGFPNSGKHKSIFGQRKYEQNFPSYISNGSHIPYNSYVPAYIVSETPKPVNSNSPRPFVQGQAPIPMIPIQPPYPKWYDSNARCDYHAGGVGHSTENCLALKRKVQSLINVGWLSFKKSGEKPNVNENPLPNHENPKVKVVDSLVEKCKNEVHEIVMPMEALFEGLFEAGYVSHEYLDPNIRYEGYDESRHCIFHQGVAGYVVQQCQKVRSKVQQLMDSKTLTVITGPSVDNITGIGRITRSERCYKLDNLTVPSNGLILEQGRPWIHSAGVVPSTLYQKLKFIVGSKLICVMGEEDFLITKPVSTPYVEATEEALKCSFRSFEIAHATMMEATVDEVIKPHKSKVEVMTTRIMGGGGYYLNQNLETLLKTPSNDGSSTLDALIYNMKFDKESDDEDDVGISSELLRMVEEEDEVLGPHQELVEAINLGSQEESKEDMSGLSTDIVVHRVPLKPECNPVRQKLRKMKPDVLIKIKEEVQKQIEAGFLTVFKYPEWVANIVPVPKKDGKVRMCVDYRDLNRASPKDNLPLPHIDMLVNNTAGYSTFSFMDGFSGYNQIKMAEEDREKMTFITLWGTFYYKVMPFGLKNVGATYQRAMVTLFHDMMHKEIEVYVDDMIAKSKADEDHTITLQKLFDRLRKYQLKFNPSKCTFGATSGKLLGFIVSEEGIKVDPDKVRAIMEMSSPKVEKEIRGFLGRLNYISRFISHLTPTCESIFKLLCKNNPGKWNEDCEEAFNKIKQYLQSPPVLIPPALGRPLILYLTVLESSMDGVLGQHDLSGKKEHAIYYLSKKFTDYESRYSTLERTCCALVWTAHRLRQYMLYHTTCLISKMDPIKYIFEKSSLSGRIAKWQVLLSEYDIVYVTKKAIKGSAVADHLAAQPEANYEPMRIDFSDENIFLVEKNARDHETRTMLFDGQVMF
ncbi:uncharacterized protein E5676_scaffold384G00790 [Cucumis melo var. makuwa]|uniref:Reverse transcriptase domain-containing protein n=1 Tax=Cucumis melo var. makuwa TaxID=1194695 RepID=A0A5A7VK41_CUCMM|nr:uncharacterized protein E6C27_scaffold271G00850 [Cucumis melo var. makuwa]TYK27894.1 uncharacterized protein E5676_scaffold384G00790 [Cucumis melo var. makuwa]